MTINLLEEARDKLNEHGLTPDLVLWVGAVDYGWFSWEEFAALSNTEYDNSFGFVYVRRDLLIVGLDWWLERQEYEGSESWKFKRLPLKPAFNITDPKEQMKLIWEG